MTSEKHDKIISITSHLPHLIAYNVAKSAQHVEKNGGKVACFISQSTPKDVQEYISSKFHSHVVDITNPEEMERWFNTAKTNLGEILGVIHVTGKLPEIGKLTELNRAGWEELVAKFISTPATVAQRWQDHEARISDFLLCHHRHE